MHYSFRLQFNNKSKRMNIKKLLKTGKKIRHVKIEKR